VGDVHCPAFPEELKVCYPYEKGETLKFTNAANDTLELIIEELQMTEAYSFSNNCDCVCEARLTFKTSIDEKSLLSISGSIITLNYEDGALWCFIIRDYRTTYHSSFTISMDMITLTENYSSGSVVVKKGVGIESFYDMENNCVWVKIQ
jgi:hypothetical protein